MAKDPWLGSSIYFPEPLDRQGTSVDALFSAPSILDPYTSLLNYEDQQLPQLPAYEPPSPSLSASVTSNTSCINNSNSCNASFGRPSELKKYPNQRTRSHACPEDSCRVRPFTTKGDLTRHRHEVHGRDHLGHRIAKLPCPESSCARYTRGFSRKEHLVNHVKKRHPPGPVTSNACDETKSTGSKFPMKASLGNRAEPQSTVSGDAFGSSTTSAQHAYNYDLRDALEEQIVTLQSKRQDLERNIQVIKDQIDQIRRTITVLEHPGS
jgi:hypothetical protein